MSNPHGYIASIKAAAARQDRGMLAELRAASSPTTRPRAYQHMASFCDLKDESEVACFATVGAALAGSPGSDRNNSGNLGAHLRSLAKSRGQKPASHPPTVARLRRILSCRDSVEVCAQLGGMLRLMGSSGVPVDHTKLLQDLLEWGDQVKREWAKGYYA